MKSATKISSFLFIYFAVSCNISSCNSHNNYKTISPAKVQQMMDSVAQNISHNGPKEWLNYFEDTPSFYMASDGKLVFPDYNTATKFINDTLINIITTINLEWNNIHVDVLNNNTASVRAAFHEDIKLKQGNAVKYDGYFTAVIDNTSAGLKFRNLHWSIIKP